jgi:hypothetical protein
MKNRNTYGFVILFGFTATSLEGQKDSPLTDEQLGKIHNLLEELIDPVHYDNDVKECPDVQIMVNPSEAFQIFCDFYDENQQLIESILEN